MTLYARLTGLTMVYALVFWFRLSNLGCVNPNIALITSSVGCVKTTKSLTTAFEIRMSQSEHVVDHGCEGWDVAIQQDLNDGFRG